MINVSNAFNEAFKSPTRQVLVRVTMKNVVYTNNDVFNVEYTGGSITGETFNIGSVFSNSIKITFTKVIEAIKQLDKIKLEFGIVLADGSREFVSMGYFFVDKYNPDRNANRTVIEALDQMTQLERVYKSKLTYPARIKDVALEIANLSGSVVDQASFERLSTSAINKIEGKTYRQAIGLIAQFAGGFAIFDRDGKLSIRTLSDTNFAISTAEYFSRGLTKNETMYTLGGISCKVTTKNGDTTSDFMLQSGSPLGNQIVLENSSMTQILLDGIYQQLKNTNYYPYTLSWRGNPALEAGDWISMSDTKANSFKMPNLTYKLSFSGGLKATSSADTSSVSQASASYRGPLKQQVLELQGWKSAAGGWTYTGTTEPSTPKEGDVWFKPNGPDTETWTYVAGKWVFQTSTAGIREAKEAASDASSKATTAKSDASTALTNANSAVDKANQASGKADTSTTIANDAKAQASTAVTNAGKARLEAGKSSKDVIDLSILANAANSNASSAVTNANKAIADSGKLSKDVTDLSAITNSANVNASTALANANKALADANKALADASKLSKDVTDASAVANDAKTQANTATASAGKAISDAKTAYDKATENSGKIVTANQEIDKVKGSITTKVDKTDFDKSLGRITQNKSSITQNANAITQKVSSTDVENILTGKAYATKSEVVQTSNSLTSTIAGVRTDVEGISIGGQNLATQTITPISITGTNTENQITSNYVFIDKIANLVTTNDFLTLSFSWVANANSGSFTPRAAGIPYTFGDIIKSTGTNSDKSMTTNISPSNQSGKVVIVFKVNSAVATSGFGAGGFRLDFFESGKNLTISNYKLERGNKATDWSSADVDKANQTQVTQMVQDLNGFKTTVSDTYLTTTSASNTYPTKDAISSTYLNKGDASSTYLNKNDASNTYPTKTTVTSQINQKATDITSSVQSWTNDKLTGYSTVQQTNNSITSAVASKADKSQITQLSDQITSTVANIAVGTNNIIQNGSALQDKEGWYQDFQGSGFMLASHDCYLNGKQQMFAIKNTTASGDSVRTIAYRVKRNTTYSFSIGMFGGNVKKATVLIIAKADDSTKTYDKVTLAYQGAISGIKVERKNLTFINGDYDTLYIRVDHDGATNVGAWSMLYWTEVMMVEGNTLPASWVMSSGETASKSQISQLVQDLNGFKTTVSSTYLTTTSASNTYPTKDAVSGTYLNKGDASSTYLNKNDASNTYPTKTTVTSQINQKATDITSSVQSWTNNKLTGYSTVQQTQDSITSAVSGKADKSQITQLSDQITSTVANIAVGTNNIIQNGSALQDKEGWYQDFQGSGFILASHDHFLNGKQQMFAIKNTTASGDSVRTIAYRVKRNTTYSFSIGMFGGNVKKTSVYILAKSDDSSKTFDKVTTAYSGSVGGASLEYKKTTFINGEFDTLYIRIDHEGASTVGAWSVLYWTEVMLVEGNALPASWVMSSAETATQSQITTQQTQINQTAQAITLKAETATVDALKGTVDAQGTSISQNAKSILTKASQSLVDTLTGRVNSAETNIDVSAKGITSLVTKTDGTNASLSQLKQDYSGFKTSVYTKSETDTKVSTVQQSVDSLKTSVSSTYATKDLALQYQGELNNDSSADNLVDGWYSVNAWGGIGGRMWGKLTSLAANGHSTQQFISGAGNIFTRSKQGNQPAWSHWQQSASKVDTTNLGQQITTQQTQIDQTAKAITLKADTTTVNAISGRVSATESSLSVQSDKITALTSKTDGQTTQISNLQTSYNGLSSTIATFQNDLDGKATKTQFSNLNQTVSSLSSTVAKKAEKSQITQLATNINLRVKADDVVNQVNVSKESILIAGSKVQITGQTYIENGVIKTASIADAAITNAKIGSLSADKLTVGTLNGANVNIINLNASNISAGTITGRNISINLNTGEVLFQKGIIKRSDGKFSIDVTNGILENYTHNGGYTLKDGEISFRDSGILNSGSQEVYGSIVYNWDPGLAMSHRGIFVKGTKSWGIGTSNAKLTPMSGNKGSFIGGSTDSYAAFFSEKQILIQAGESTLTKSCFIRMGYGSNSGYPGRKMDIVGEKITLTGTDKIHIAGNLDIYGDQKLVGSLSVVGSKNAIHATRDGVRATPAYETAESYLGDIGQNYTRVNCEVWIEIEQLFSDTVNTDIAYQVFLQAYDDAKFWVAEFKSDGFLIKSDKPMSRFAWEIKAKRRGYENDRLVLQDDFDNKKIEESWREK